jgi:hypothetical protein
MIHGAPGRPVRLDAGPGPKRPQPEVGRPVATTSQPAPAAPGLPDHRGLGTSD